MQECYDKCLAAFDFVKSEELVSSADSLPAKPDVISQYACCEWSEDDGCLLGYGTGVKWTGRHAALLDAYSVAVPNVSSDKEL